MKSVLFIILIFILSSCGDYVEFKEELFVPTQGTLPAKKVTFSEVSDKIFKTSCTQCHPGYSDYNSVFPDANKILDAVLTGRMPKNAPALNQDSKELLNSWVRDGAPLSQEQRTRTKPPGQSEPNDELVATWSSISKKLIFPKCVSCHNPSGQASFLDLSTRQSFFNEREYLLNNLSDANNSYLVEILRDTEEPMPPVWSGIERLSEKEIQVIIEWIDKGLP